MAAGSTPLPPGDGPEPLGGGPWSAGPALQGGVAHDGVAHDAEAVVRQALAESGADHSPAGQSLPYRTAFETALDFRLAERRVYEQLRSWLKSKGFDPGRLDAGQSRMGRRADLFYVARNTIRGWQLRERMASDVTCLSTVVVTGEDPQRTWVSVNIEVVAPAGRTPRSPAPPGLIRLLLDAIDARDADALLRARPTVVTAAGVDDFLDVVCALDGRRRLPMVVAAAPPDVPFEQWRRAIEEITGELPGLASAYLLDPAAATCFDSGLSETHRIGPGNVRTYLPEVDPAVTEDAVRHRLMRRRRIESDRQYAARVLAALPRQLAANALPPAAAKGLSLSLRDFTVDEGARRPDGSVPPDLPDRIEVYEGLLKLADENERQLKETLSGLQDEVLDLAADLEVTRDELEKRDATIRNLKWNNANLTRSLARARQAGSGDRDGAPAAGPPAPPSPLPRSFGELLDRVEEAAPHVVFTGDRGACLQLDEHPLSSLWAQLAWQGMLALADYARTKQAGTFYGDFREWCKSPPDGGRVIPAGKVVLDESETVRNNRRYARSRSLPVPVAVDPSGEVFMGAHIRIANSSTVAPRLYFHDASASHHAVYVGYIGRHLPNTLTS